MLFAIKNTDVHDLSIYLELELVFNKCLRDQSEEQDINIPHLLRPSLQKLSFVKNKEKTIALV